MRNPINRRDFLKQAGTASLGLSLASYIGSTPKAAAAAGGSTLRAIGPNDKFRVAVIGTNGRGLAHVECLTNLPGVEVAYICDVDDRAIVTGIKGHREEPESGAEGA